MATVEEIIQSGKTAADIIKELSVKITNVKSWAELEKEYDPMKHRIITDVAAYPDKPIYDDNGVIIRYEKITRVAIGLQKLAAKRIGEFMFTLPALLTCEDAKDDEFAAAQFGSIKRVLARNRWDALNKKRCRINSSECEQAVYWYLVDTGRSHKAYGFDTTFKIKYQIFSPANGDSLYPLFDNTGDMIAFSRGTTINNSDGSTTAYFDCWTADKYYQWRKTSGGNDWEVTKDGVINQIGKIPIIYGYRSKPIWDDADNGKVHELELLLSRNGDVVAYHASPVLVLQGDIDGAPLKGESNKVYVSSNGKGDAKYVSWAQSPETVKFQYETLLQMFWTELQLPDLSLENIKGLGATSGEARKWLLADAHLKVGDESEIYTTIIDRELNVIKSLLAVINPEWDGSIEDISIDTEIRPFTIRSERDNIDVIVAANGGKPTISQRTSVELSGLVSDANAEYEQIIRESENDNKTSIFEPTH